MNMFEDTTDRESSLAEIKRSIRAAALARRKAIPEAERIARSANICDALIEKLDGLPDARGDVLLGTRDVSERGESVRDESARGKNAQDESALLEALQADALRASSSAAPYTVAVYCAIASEVSLDRFIDYAYERGCRVCFPCMEEIAPVRSAERSQSDRRDDRPSDHQGDLPDNRLDDHPETSMTFRDVSAEAFALKEAQFLTHPALAYRADDPALSAFPLVPAQDIDLAIIPLVAFDANGNRLGYGKGNYDRFLPSLSPKAQLVGAAFTEQQVDVLPCEPFDKPLPEIISG